MSGLERYPYSIAFNLEQLAVNPHFKLLHNRYPQFAMMVFLILSGNGGNTHGAEVVNRIIVV
ncbi:MAG: hypothetical protein QXH93_04255 [Conexivisphaerales archaeon]